MNALFHLVFFVFFACRHRIQIDSQPVGAQIYRGQTLVGVVPQEITFWWQPFQEDKVELRLLGYRSFMMPLSYPIERVPLDILYFRYDILFGFTPVKHTVIMQKES